MGELFSELTLVHRRLAFRSAFGSGKARTVMSLVRIQCASRAPIRKWVYQLEKAREVHRDVMEYSEPRLAKGIAS